MGWIIASGLGLLALLFASSSRLVTFEPGGVYAFTIRAELGAMPSAAGPMLSALLLSQYSLQATTLEPDPAGDPTLWRGVGVYLNSVPSQARDSANIRWVSITRS